MLGQALSTRLTQNSVSLFNPRIKFNWDNQTLVCAQLNQTAAEFILQATHEPWQIYWAAGSGTMHSSEADLQTETYALEGLISTLLNISNLNLGTFSFASSAGAIYAGSPEDLINEFTPPAPINAYGKTKLFQEDLVKLLNQNGRGATVITYRISTLYGLKKINGRHQGLIAEIIRKALLNEAIHIYVPLETMRDYITPTEAAILMIESTILLEKFSGTHIKIIASGISTSIAQILAILKRICKRNLRVVTQADNKSAQYQRVIQFQPNISMPKSYTKNQNLIEGILELMHAIQKDFANKID